MDDAHPSAGAKQGSGEKAPQSPHRKFLSLQKVAGKLEFWNAPKGICRYGKLDISKNLVSRPRASGRARISTAKEFHVNHKTVRISTLVAVTATAVAVVAPMASATAREHTAEAHYTQQTRQVADAQDQIDLLAAIKEAGFDERLLALPSSPSPWQVAEALYPGNADAQRAALPLLIASASDSVLTGLEDLESRGLKDWWNKGKRVAACVGAVGTSWRATASWSPRRPSSAGSSRVRG
ncbi:hypothetical protein OYE22_16880 [Streptomyces sp. 71268]|uniref:hypothetical protein n=1 Tax=Streptomyces sp. 71268 TaxID=3002640 RepID=UPI0023F7E07A|nr:hypothetical protein [Streptomyces sp. 71268]WEV26687.1 hypothetical protein OYE22_16880 [Streptomyces sp. 71268]